MHDTKTRIGTVKLADLTRIGVSWDGTHEAYIRCAFGAYESQYDFTHSKFNGSYSSFGVMHEVRLKVDR